MQQALGSLLLEKFHACHGCFAYPKGTLPKCATVEVLPNLSVLYSSVLC